MQDPFARDPEKRGQKEFRRGGFGAGKPCGTRRRGIRRKNGLFRDFEGRSQRRWYRFGVLLETSGSLRFG